MDIYNSMFSQAFIINEQIARQIFETIPDQGPVIVIIDNDGNIWPSDSEEYSKLEIHESFLKELRMKIDDGVEPVVAQENGCGYIAAQIATDKSICGYVIIILPDYNTESMLANISLIEMLLNQFSLIAKLIETNNQFYSVQTQRYMSESYDTVSLN